MTSPKLKDAPIVEALLDLRFDPHELAEVVIGRLSEIPIWPNSTRIRLPTADIPAPLRAATPQLRFVPSLEIGEAGGVGKVRVGANVVSVHFPGHYKGWESVSPTMETVTDGLFRVLPNLVVQRLGLRYINVFTAERHFVQSVNDLTLRVTVAGTALDAPVNIIFSYDASPNHKVLTRIASRPFLQGKIPPDATVAVDIDVSTPDGFSDSSPQSIKAWIHDAHTFEKRAFRRLLPDALYEALLESSHARSTH
jgi:uncharacterized protein (TIGR04255 family)